MRSPRFPFVLIVLGGILLHQQTAVCQSPYTLSTSREILIVSLGTAAGIGAALVHGSTDPLTAEEIAGLSAGNVNAFDRGATERYSAGAGDASDILVYGIIVAPTVMLADRQVQRDWQVYAAMYAEAMLLTGSAVQLTKGLVARTRPYVYNPNVPAETKREVDARRSFYSSHTAFAFTSAVFLSVTYGAYFPHSRWRPWIWAFSLSAAATVGYLRYAAGQHFPTDILTGAIVGAAIGYAVPLLHQERSADVSILPTAGARSATLTVVLHF